MNWKERRHKRLRKRSRKEPWIREFIFIKKGKWRKAMYALYFSERREPVHEGT